MKRLMILSILFFTSSAFAAIYNIGPGDDFGVLGLVDYDTLLMTGGTGDMEYDIVVGSGDIYPNLVLDNKKTLINGGSVEYLGITNQSVVDIVSTSDYPGLSVGIKITGVNDSTVNVSGGKFMKISTGGNDSILNISGGTFTMGIDLEGFYAQGHLSGGEIPNIGLVGRECDLHFWGYNFTLQDLNSYDRYLVTGYWESGIAFSTEVVYYQQYGNQIIFHEIPEPATILLFGLGGLALRKRR